MQWRWERRENGRLAYRSCGLWGWRRHPMPCAPDACGHAPQCAAEKSISTLLKRRLASTAWRPMSVGGPVHLHPAGIGHEAPADEMARGHGDLSRIEDLH